MRYKKFKGALKTEISAEQYFALEQADKLKYKIDHENQVFRLSLTLTRALAKAYVKAEKFVLMLACKLDQRHYLAQKEGFYGIYYLTTNIKEAKKYALGFDDQTQKANKLMAHTGLQLVPEILGVKISKQDNPQLLTPETMNLVGVRKGKVKRTKIKINRGKSSIKKKRSVPKANESLLDVFDDFND